MTRKKSGISEAFFKVKYLKRSRQLYRRYLEAKPWVRQLYREVLQLKPEMRIVDVGCGTGDFTRHLASLIRGKCQIIGVDMREESLKAAEAETRKARLSRTISYRKGDAYSIPVENVHADLTCCRTLLIHLQEPLRALKEMIRATREGGMVAAVEPGEMFSLVDPEDEEFTELAREINRAYYRGVRRLEGKDYELGDKLPGLFRKAGLVEVRVELQADAWTPADSRLSLSYLKATVQLGWDTFKSTKKDTKRSLLAGGAPARKVAKFFFLQEKRFRKLLSNDYRLRNDTTFSGSTLYIVTGRKKRTHETGNVAGVAV